jgi:hypothetical protein
LIFFVEGTNGMSDARIAVYVTGAGSSNMNIMSVDVPVGTTKVIAVSQQLPAGCGIAVALVRGVRATVTANGIITKID